MVFNNSQNARVHDSHIGMTRRKQEFMKKSETQFNIINSLLQIFTVVIMV